jgi:hypothetical protein
MPQNLESLSEAARTAVLAHIARALTICARDTYEVGTENVLDPHTLRAYNELLHRITSSVVDHLSRRKGYSLESIVEMMRSFGVRHNRAAEMEWALERVLQTIQKEPTE